MQIILSANSAWNIYNFRVPIILRLIEEGHTVTVVAPPDTSVENITELGCKFIPLEMDKKGLSPLNDLRLILRFMKFFSNVRPDIVLSYTIKNNVFGGIAARLTRTNFLPNVTGLGTAFLSGSTVLRVAKFLYKTSFKKFPIVIFQNSYDKNLFLNYNILKKNQCKLLPGSGIDLEKFPYSPLEKKKDQTVFLMIARLIKDKGVNEYYEAAQKVKAINPQARFLILGELGSENRGAISSEQLQSWISSGTIEHIEHTSDVRPIIQTADCVVLPSYREGAPRALMEAACMGKPAIATDVPGCNSVVEDGVTGFLCDVADSQSLANACLKFIALSHEDRAALSKAARTKMEREFDVKIVVEKYSNFIADITGQSKPV